MNVNLLFYCKFCTNKARTLKGHLQHFRIHRHLTRLLYCGLGHCLSAFRNENSLRSHIIRTHKTFVSKATPRSATIPANNGISYKCPIKVCGKDFLVQKLLISHLREHLKSRSSVPCIVCDCTKTFSSVNSLTGHIYKKHKHNNFIEKPLIVVPSNVCESAVPLEDYFAPDEEVTQLERKQESTVALAQFFQKLEYKHMVPASVSQVIFKEMQHFLFSMERCFLDSMSSALGEEGIAPELISSILSTVSRSNELLDVCHTLRSDYMRKSFYENHFNFVAPLKIPLQNGSYFYYVPIEKTIQAAFSSKAWYFDMNIPTSNDGVLRDFYDGETFKRCNFFQEHPQIIPLILYQDGYELTCPIGPASNLKHKLLGIYLAFGNLPSDIRFKKDSIQLVALCRSCDFNHSDVYGLIVRDLISIQTNGVHIINAGLCKARITFISGDNLGSHGLAGLVESFSKAHFFCRYCLVSQAQFKKIGGETRRFKRRTAESYKEDLKHVKVLPDGRIKNHHGVKFDSIFNSIPDFHVMSPMLPPCLGHDLCEGVIAYDLKIFIRYFISKGWFGDRDGLRKLNDLIESFPYSVEEKKDRPCIIKKLEKKRLAGGAWQLFNFIRLFPLIVYGYVKDPNDEVWKLLLLLRKIALFAVAPEIHVSHLASFQWDINEYLTTRRDLFPLIPLRPKHHYLSHYPELILYFGPLIKVWTLRFESKHTFFNKSWKSSNNSINVLHTLSHKHEYFQSWIRSGGNASSTVEAEARVPYHHVLHSDGIRSAVESCVNSFSQFEETKSVIVKGTSYRKGDVLVIQQVSDSTDLRVGIVHVILLGPQDDVTFVLKKSTASFVSCYGAYKLNVFKDFECVKQVDLQSFYPLEQYERNTGMYICLRHALVNFNFDPQF